jgi:hypothetical protein
MVGRTRVRKPQSPVREGGPTDEERDHARQAAEHLRERRIPGMAVVEGQDCGSWRHCREVMAADRRDRIRERDEVVSSAERGKVAGERLGFRVMPEEERDPSALSGIPD